MEQSLTVPVVGTESYSQARMHESDFAEKDKETPDENTGDVESRPRGT